MKNYFKNLSIFKFILDLRYAFSGHIFLCWSSPKICEPTRIVGIGFGTRSHVIKWLTISCALELLPSTTVQCSTIFSFELEFEEAWWAYAAICSNTSYIPTGLKKIIEFMFSLKIFVMVTLGLKRWLRRGGGKLGMQQNSDRMSQTRSRCDGAAAGCTSRDQNCHGIDTAECDRASGAWQPNWLFRGRDVRETPN